MDSNSPRPDGTEAIRYLIEAARRELFCDDAMPGPQLVGTDMDRAEDELTALRTRLEEAERPEAFGDALQMSHTLVEVCRALGFDPQLRPGSGAGAVTREQIVGKIMYYRQMHDAAVKRSSLPPSGGTE
jgi:hypothetical protein